MIDISPYQGSQTINVPGGTIQWVTPEGAPAEATAVPSIAPALPVFGLSPIRNSRRYRPRYVHAPHRPKTGTGRNDPCPCGSGRKSKRCCRGAL